MKLPQGNAKRRRLTNSVTELAKERNRAAAERTMASWIQNCLSLIGFGIAFARIARNVARSFPGNSTLANARIAQAIGLTTIAIGIMLLILVIVAYLSEIKSLQQENYAYRPLQPFSLDFTIVAVILFGVAALIVVLIRSL
jgi:putative membrane protein